jgi:hypothetical protein
MLSSVKTSVDGGDCYITAAVQVMVQKMEERLDKLIWNASPLSYPGSAPREHVEYWASGFECRRLAQCHWC